MLSCRSIGAHSQDVSISEVGIYYAGEALNASLLEIMERSTVLGVQGQS